MYSGNRQPQASYQRNYRSHIVSSSAYGRLFQELVTTRKTLKEEKVKARLNKGRQCIKERINAESESKIMGIPNEIWGIILSFLNDAKDLASTWEAHPKFEKLSEYHKFLKSHHHEFLLSLFFNKSSEILWKDTSIMCSTFKTLRQVSKAMQISVDRLLQENFMKALHSPGLRLQPNVVTRAIFDGTLHMDERMEQMLRDYSGGYAKTLYSKSLEVRMENRLPMGMVGMNFFQFQMYVTSLLEKIGDQIWYFRFVLNSPNGELRGTGISLREIYLYIQQWMFLLPNLKWLSLELHSSDDAEGSIIQKTFENHPLPRRDQLERIQLNIDVPFAPLEVIIGLVASVIRPNLSVIKAMELECGPTFLREMKPFFYEMDLCHFACVSPCVSSESILASTLVNSNRNLSSLSVVDIGIGPLDLGGLFHFLNKFPTLEHVSIHTSMIQFPCTYIPLLELKKLIQFELSFGIGWRGSDCGSETQMDTIILFSSLEFLVSCMKLKEITWLFNSFTDTETTENWEVEESEFTFADFQDLLNRHDEDGLIQFKSGLQTDLTNSNIWHVFPELEFVKILVPGNLDCKIYKKIKI